MVACLFPQDADDVMFPHRIERQVEALLAEEKRLAIKNSSRNSSSKRSSNVLHAADEKFLLSATAAAAAASPPPVTEAPPTCQPTHPLLPLPPPPYPWVLVGCNFERLPIDSTAHYTNWANSLTQ